MNDIYVTKCKKHGFLTEEQCYRSNSKESVRGFRYRCKECFVIYKINQNPESRARQIKKYSDKRKGRRAEVNAMVREDRKNNPEKYAKWQKDHYERNGNREKISLKCSLKTHKLSLEEHNKMVKEQDNKCAICKLSEVRLAANGKNITRLCIDHDHETGAIRALLCHDCNSGIGKFKDCTELLLEAADYLMRYK